VPAKLEKIDFNFGVGPDDNLIAAWHDQLIELHGAMGMREPAACARDVGRGHVLREPGRAKLLETVGGQE